MKPVSNRLPYRTRYLYRNKLALQEFIKMTIRTLNAESTYQQLQIILNIVEISEHSNSTHTHCYCSMHCCTTGNTCIYTVAHTRAYARTRTYTCAHVRRVRLDTKIPLLIHVKFPGIVSVLASVVKAATHTITHTYTYKLL